MNKKTKTIIWIVVAIVGVFLVGLLLSDVIAGAQEKTFNEFLTLLKAGQINRLHIDAYNWTGYLVDANGKIMETAYKLKKINTIVNTIF